MTSANKISKVLEELLNDNDNIVELDRRLPPILRSVWIALPEDIQKLLERAHGYSHFNPKTDMIETDHDRYSTFEKLFEEGEVLFLGAE